MRLSDTVSMIVRRAAFRQGLVLLAILAAVVGIGAAGRFAATDPTPVDAMAADSVPPIGQLAPDADTVDNSRECGAGLTTACVYQ